MVQTSWLRKTCFIVVSVLVVSNLAINQPEAPCPRGCTCDLESVDCLHGNLTSIPIRLPTGNTIRKIVFARNKIQQINFELNNYPELHFLDFTNNNISFIEKGAFWRLDSLEHLLLSRNFIAKTDKFTFTNLSLLKHLDISYNTLRCIRNENFQDLSNLHSLDLTRNQLQLVELKAFYGLITLQVLNLTRNHLDIFPVRVFEVLTSLKMLILEDNQISYLPPFAFAKLANLEYLSLTGNRLQTIAPASLMTPLSTNMHLHELYLRGTNLENIPSELFKELSSLKVLDLSQTRISTLSNNLLTGLSSLEYFTMTSSEYLTSIEYGAFQDLHWLAEVVISENRFLSDISNVSFTSAKRLRVLDLSKNSLKTFSRELVSWSSNIIVDLRENNFECDCNLSWLHSVLPYVHNNQTKTNLLLLYCDSPDQLIGQQVALLSHSDYRCSTVKAKLTHNSVNRAKIGAISAGVACVVLVTLAVLVKFRKQLCMLIRRQYRYSSYRGKHGVFTVNSDNYDSQSQDEATPMEEMYAYSDDIKCSPDVILMTNNNRK